MLRLYGVAVWRRIFGQILKLGLVTGPNEYVVTLILAWGRRPIYSQEVVFHFF